MTTIDMRWDPELGRWRNPYPHELSPEQRCGGRPPDRERGRTTPRGRGAER